MGIFRKIAGSVGAAALCLGLASQAAAESLADALAYGYEASGLLEQNRALLRAADEGVANAVSALMPVVSWSLSAQSQFPQVPNSDFVTGGLQLQAEMTLYDGGRNQLAVDGQKELVLATRQGLVNIEQQVLLRIVEAYMEVRRASEFVALRENNVRLITQELRAAEDRFEVGEITRTDVASAEARLASARSQLAAEQGTLARAIAEYVAAVGRQPGQLQPASQVPIRRSLREIKEYALRNHPVILQARHSVASADISVERAELAHIPTVSLNGTARIDFEGRETQSIGLNVGGPIYQGGRLASQLREAQARRDAARADLYVTAQSIEQNVTNAYAFWEVARASRDASERQVRAATIAFRGVREEADLGARTTLDVLNAEQELLDARANLIAAQVDEIVASYTVLSSMGLLTAEHLNLNVQLYDPEAYYNLVKDAPTQLSEQGRALDRVLEALGQE
jgi:outer membrane protein